MTESRLTRLIHELRRRRVARIVIAYAAGAFALLQAADLAVEAALLPEGAFRSLFILALVGFPLAVVLGWVLEVTPEGIRVTGPEGAPQRPVLARLRPWAIYGGGALLLAVGLGLVVVLNVTRLASAEVAPGADVIAVLPFNATGSGVEMLGEGMVDLLSRNLDEVGAIRTVDARTVLYHWQRRERTGDAEAEALAVGRAVRAGSVLTGSVVAGGEQVRLSAELRDLEGRRLAAVQVDGAAQQVLTLVDSLSVALLRRIWRSARPLPELDVAAITSGDLEAIRWFLRGERFYRASEWDSALTSFANAVAADGVFPLAHYRLATTAGWVRSSEEGGLGRASAMLALRFADRLPMREQVLVWAMALGMEDRRGEAADTLRAYLRRYPDDAEAWFAVADNEFHLRDELRGPYARPIAEQLESFDRALALDPSFTPALIHPLEVVFRAADTARVRRYVESLRSVPASQAAAAGAYRRAAAVLSGPPDGERVSDALDHLLATMDTAWSGLIWQAFIATAIPLTRAAALLPASERDAVIARMHRRVGTSGDAYATPVLMQVLVAGGRLAEGRALLDAAAARSKRDVSHLARAAVLSGYAGKEFLGDDVSSTPPVVLAAADLAAAIDAGDAEAMRRAGRVLNDLSAAGEGPAAGALASAAEGFARIAAADTAAGLREVEAALEPMRFSAGSTAEAFALRWLERLALFTGTRERGLELLARPWEGDPAYEVLRQHALGRALAAAGRDDEARAVYGRFLDALAGADAGLGIEWRIEQARDLRVSANLPTLSARPVAGR